MSNCPAFLYHQLVWQPGMQMHPEWWALLGLESWQARYKQLSITTRRKLDQLIHQQRMAQGFLVLPEKRFTTEQQILLQAKDRLSFLSLALGIVLSQCPDYLLWRPYRQVLASYFNSQQLEQLWGLWRGGQKTPDITPDDFVASVHQQGIQALQQGFAHDPVWQALSYTLPVIPAGEPAGKMQSAVPVFLRLERFL